MVEDNVTNSAIQSSAGGDSVELNAAEIQKALTELESSLMYSVAQLGPALEAIEEQLHKAAAKIREEGDAGILWNCLENLQHFLKLLETITVTAGISPTDIASFDNALSGGLEDLEKRMNEAATGEDIAVGIEATLIPALRAWPECEAALFSVVEPRPLSS